MPPIDAVMTSTSPPYASIGLEDDGPSDSDAVAPRSPLASPLAVAAALGSPVEGAAPPTAPRFEGETRSAATAKNHKTKDPNSNVHFLPVAVHPLWFLAAVLSLRFSTVEPTVEDARASRVVERRDVLTDMVWDLRESTRAAMSSCGLGLTGLGLPETESRSPITVDGGGDGGTHEVDEGEGTQGVPVKQRWRRPGGTGTRVS